jgi:uncharacterized protein (TIGR03492 family)
MSCASARSHRSIQIGIRIVRRSVLIAHSSTGEVGTELIPISDRMFSTGVNLTLSCSSKQILCLSNGHGEDLITGQIIQAMRQDQPQSKIKIAAMPIVGSGNAYQKLGVPMIGPTQTLPSGGVFYMNPFMLVRDLWSGLISLTWQQLRAVWQYSRACDLLLVTGDIVVVAIAHLTGRPYMVMLCAHSSYYEGRVELGWLLWRCLSSARCLAVFTRDQRTATDLNQQGLTKAWFAGTPVMDALVPQGKDLKLKPNWPMIALLPGSRLPEARHNLELMLHLAIAITQQIGEQAQFWAALVPNLMTELAAIAQANGWQYQVDQLTYALPTGIVTIQVAADAFADIIQQSSLVIGMTGTAIEQAVGLGKPVITIPGLGPAFTYRFAEAQMRLLGPSIQVIGDRPADAEILQQAAQRVQATLADATYLQACRQNGRERMGEPGGSLAIANFLANYLAGLTS